MKNFKLRFVLMPFLLMGLSLLSVFAQQKRIYIAPDDHTDYMWTANEATYKNAFLDMTDYYLNQMDATANNPSSQQARFNPDGSFWMWTYQKNRTPAQFQRFIARVRDGHLSVPLNPLVQVNGGTPAEAVLRGMYYPGLIERQYNVRFPIAISMENQTFPFGLSSLWAGSGAKYSWRGVCDCVTRVPNLSQPREREIYYSGGADGSRVLTKWNSLHPQFGSQIDKNQGIGGYAEARFPTEVINFVDTNSLFRSLYSPNGNAANSYNVIGAFGQGWDDLQTLNTAFVDAAQTQSNVNRQVIVSNQIDFFQDFETSFGANLPTYSASFGNEWELYVSSLAEVSARVKRATEKLRTAEAMATLVSQRNPAFMNNRITARDTAMLNLGLYFEHDWTANGPVLRTERADWQRRTEAAVTSYVDTLHDDAKTVLGTYITKIGTNRRFFVFNSLSWARTDYADFPHADTSPIHVIDVSTNQEVPSQIVTVDGQRRLRILAENVPSVGYKVFEIRSGAGQTFTNAATVTGSVIENDFYRITISNAGAITSLNDKTRGNRELVRVINGRTVNDLGVTGGTLSVENVGAVSVTVRTVSTASPAHTTRITFVRNTNRIEIRNDITQNFSDVRTWSFAFNLDSPDVRHEEVGAVIRAKLLADGGNYSPRNARYDWLTLNHFADVSSNNGGANAVGVTLSNADTYFMKLGNSTVETLDVNTPQINVLAGGQVDGTDLGIQGQGGDLQFMQRFALRTHDNFDKTAAMKFALEHQNPFAVGEVTGTNALSQKTESQNLIYDSGSFSFALISNPNVLLWALKPAEDGINRGIVARVWNMSDAPANYNLSLAENISTAKRVTHIETDITDATVTSGRLTAAANGNQIQSHRVMILAPTAAGTDISGRVLLRGNRGLGKVKVTLFNSINQTMLEARTNGNGYFYFTNVAAGGTVIVGASKTGYAFKPTEQIFSNFESRSVVDFTVNYRGF